MSFRIDGQCPGCNLAFDVNITPMYVHEGFAISVDDAVAEGLIKEWPASLAEKREPFVPIRSEEAAPLPATVLDEPEDLDNTAPTTPASRAAAAHQATNQEATRERAAAGRVCPRHHKAKPSHYGGMYCNSGDSSESTGWCKWTSKTAANEEAA